MQIAAAPRDEHNNMIVINVFTECSTVTEKCYVITVTVAPNAADLLTLKLQSLQFLWRPAAASVSQSP